MELLLSRCLGKAGSKSRNMKKRKCKPQRLKMMVMVVSQSLSLSFVPANGNGESASLGSLRSTEGPIRSQEMTSSRGRFSALLLPNPGISSWRCSVMGSNQIIQCAVVSYVSLMPPINTGCMGGVMEWHLSDPVERRGYSVRPCRSHGRQERYGIFVAVAGCRETQMPPNLFPYHTNGLAPFANFASLAQKVGQHTTGHRRLFFRRQP